LWSFSPIFWLYEGDQLHRVINFQRSPFMENFCVITRGDVIPP
jgi:hypothetical protein